MQKEGKKRKEGRKKGRGGMDNIHGVINGFDGCVGTEKFILCLRLNLTGENMVDVCPPAAVKLGIEK